MEVAKNSLTLDAVVYKEEHYWLAHCLQLDLAEAGATPEKAIDALADVIRAHIEWVMEDDDMEHLFHAAPKELWQAWYEAAASGFREISVEPKTDTASTFLTIRLQRADAVTHAA